MKHYYRIIHSNYQSLCVLAEDIIYSTFFMQPDIFIQIWFISPLTLMLISKLQL